MREAFVVDREMGCTREELLRWLPGATRHVPCRADGDELVFTVAPGEVRVHARELAPRRIAGLALPTLAVRFRFVDLDAPARERFLTWFDRYTQRGGG